MQAIERLLTFCLVSPGFWQGLGSVLELLGLGPLLVGGLLSVLPVVDGLFKRLAHTTSAPADLATLLPGWSTWWIPETPIAFAFYFLVALCGVVSRRHGQQLRRIMGSNAAW